MSTETRAKRASDRFLCGYNCAQAVVAAFSDLCGADESLLLRAASSFGGGVGRLREMCGAVSGMVMVAGMLYGYDDPSDRDVKVKHYTVVRELCAQFAARHGSIVCREILGGAAQIGGDPAERTPIFYASRPCAQCVYDAADILEAYLKAHPPREEETSL